MGAFVRGDVLVMPFPYSDLSTHKRRPVLVLAVLPGNDLVVCQITSQVRDDTFSVPLQDVDFSAGGLKQASLIRVGRIFTAESSVVLYRAGVLTKEKQREVSVVLIKLFRLNYLA